MLAPLGVLLPNGLGLNVDGKDIGRAYFVRCFQDGCYAEVILEKPLLDTLKTGKAATFIVFQTPEEGIGIPVDLTGFSDGFKALPRLGAELSLCGRFPSGGWRCAHHLSVSCFWLRPGSSRPQPPAMPRTC